ncbi:MAG: LysM peptidoglycan-binding domain-containing protein [Firmicutes bacterium]|nr:LysM peptidoglycan-binding domain-containing protein [Bacillota bacterium]
MAGYRENNNKVIYSSRGEVRNTTGVYKSGKQRRNGIRFNKRKKRKQQMRLALLFAISVVLAAVIFINVRANSFEIVVDGEVLMNVDSKAAGAKDILETVKAQISGEIGANIEINEKVTFNPVHRGKKDRISVENALIKLKDSITYKVEAAVITVDGGEVVAMAKQEEAQEILDGIVAEFVPEGSNIVQKGFVEDVQIVSKFVESNKVATKQEALEKLTEGTKSKKEYTVVSGDGIYVIAKKNGIEPEELLEANPGIDINTVLNPGDKLMLEVDVPFLSVKTAENRVFTEKQEKEVEYRRDSTKPASYKKVIQQGVDGQKEVTTQIIRINGFETEQKVVSETTTVEPVPEIILVGTK